jgi:hypothetical protein
MKNTPALKTNWSIIKDWSEASRYKKYSENESLDLYSAVADKKHGVIRWLKLHW